jgi:BirA family biotin operon repressor/biotin-[acetyl-CoA-carboxylase] ligase
LARFTSASTWVRGKRVQVPEQGGYTGTTAGLDRNGYLLVDADDHTQRTVLSGGVREEA